MSFCSYGLLAILTCATSLSVVKPKINVHIPSEKPLILTNASREEVLGLNLGRGLVGRRLTMSDAQKSIILDKHNVLRANVLTPCAASDMETLQWDATLAGKAEEYAAKCIWAHDNAVNHPHHWGENMALSVTGASLGALVQGWYDEIVDIRWTAADTTVSARGGQHCASPDTRTGKCQITHYTNVVWAATNKVGCGWASCEHVAGLQWWRTSGVLFVCKYSPGGNTEDFYGNVYAPFQVGQVAAACSQKDISGKLCAAGDTPNRCRDELGHTLFEVAVDDARYKDCTSLKKGFKDQCAAQYGKHGVQCKDWCSDFHMAGAPRHWCNLSCNACSHSANVGASYCPGHAAGVELSSPQVEHNIHRALDIAQDSKVHYSINPSFAQLGDTDRQNAARGKGRLAAVGGS